MPGRRPLIAIVGASVRAAAFSALRAGIVPLAADLFADADLMQRVLAQRIERYPAGLADWLGTTPPGTAWMYTGALENQADLVDHMATVRPLMGCSGGVLRSVRDPLRLADALHRVGVPFPETRAAPEPPARSAPSGSGEWLLKTYRGSSGSGVRRWDGQPVSSEDGPAYLQRRVEGPAGSAVYVIDRGRARLLGVTRQLVGTAWTHAAAFQYAGTIGPWKLDPAVEETLHGAGRVLANLGVTGLCGLDFVLGMQTGGMQTGRLYVIEVNPRYTASMEVVERLTGTPLLAEHVRATSRSGRIPPDGPAHRRGGGSLEAPRALSFLGKAILFAPEAVRVESPFVAWAIGQADASPERPAIADVPQAGTDIPAGRPVLTVFAAGSSHAEVEEGLQRQVADVRRRLW